MELPPIGQCGAAVCADRGCQLNEPGCPRVRDRRPPYTDAQIERAARAHSPRIWFDFDKCCEAWNRPLSVTRDTYWFMVEPSMAAMRAALASLTQGGDDGE